MIRKLLVLAVPCALALGAAHAQSVTSAPAPTENLTRLQERVYELEALLRASTSEQERLSIELRRAKNENARLERMLNDALGQQQQQQQGAAPVAGAPTAARLPNGMIGTLPVENAPPADPAAQLQMAQRNMQMGRFAEAEAAFAAFVRANPQSPDAPEARYFVGRTQAAQRRYQEAADTFISLLRDHPSIPRAPDAWTMLGVSLKGMGKTTEACGVFRDLTVKYPRASATTRNVAATEARAAQCR
jgi:tol-pal system protein YbgF